jgi:hypothetical protein
VNIFIEYHWYYNQHWYQCELSGFILMSNIRQHILGIKKQFHNSHFYLWEREKIQDELFRLSFIAANSLSPPSCMQHIVMHYDFDLDIQWSVLCSIFMIHSTSCWKFCTLQFTSYTHIHELCNNFAIIYWILISCQSRFEVHTKSMCIACVRIEFWLNFVCAFDIVIFFPFLCVHQMMMMMSFVWHIHAQTPNNIWEKDSAWLQVAKCENWIMCVCYNIIQFPLFLQITHTQNSRSCIKFNHTMHTIVTSNMYLNPITHFIATVLSDALLQLRFVYIFVILSMLSYARRKMDRVEWQWMTWGRSYCECEFSPSCWTCHFMHDCTDLI